MAKKTKTSLEISEEFKEIIEDHMKIFDKLIDLAFHSKNADKILNDAYTSIRQKFKLRKGSGSGYTGIAEFIYLEFIKESLKRTFPSLKFLPIESETITYMKGDLGSSSNYKIILSSDIKLKHLIPFGMKNLTEFSNQRPDVFIGLRKNEKITPIAFFEIKVNIDTGDIKEKIIERFEKLESTFEIDKRPYFVFINLYCNNGKKRKELINQYLEKDRFLMMRFTGGSRKKNWVERGSVCNGIYEGSIITIMELIISDIKRQLKLEVK